MQYRMLGYIGAVETGVGLWYFTSGHWVNGLVCTLAVAFVASAYIRAQRRLSGRDGGRPCP